MNRFRRLKWQIVLINMGFVTALLLGLLFAIYSYMNKQMEQQSMNVLSTVIQEQSSLFQPIEEHSNIAIPYFTVELRRDGRPSFINGQYYSVDSPAEIETIMKIAMQSDQKSGWVEGYQFRFMKSVGQNGIRISFVDCSFENNLKTSLLYSLVSLGIVVMAAFSLLSYFFAGWIVRPIEDSWNQQKQFVADASHELKTPLTVILANAELLMKQYPDEGMTEKKWLNNIYTEARDMKTLILEMLTLARKDVITREKPILGEINLQEVLEETVLQFEPVFYQNNRNLQSDLPETPICVTSNKDSLNQVLKILLDNAIKYSPSDSITRISVQLVTTSSFLRTISQTVSKNSKGNGQEIEIIVANEGNEMTPQECRNIFKRFVRLDEARTNNNGGYGLGLSIAAQIMEEQNGKIWATSGGGWNAFHIRLQR